jgi:hypothetical protein
MVEVAKQKRAIVAKQQRKIVFFLGAGASLGAGAYTKVQHGGKVPIPTQSTFWDIFLRFCRSQKNRKRIESFLFRYFKGYARVPARMSLSERWAMLADVNVEEVFTFLSERRAAPSTSSSLRTAFLKMWEALLAELPNVFGRFKSNSDTRAVYRKFLTNFVRARDTVVSFNYDTVFEESLPQGHRWHYEGIEKKPSSLGVLKPHGSVNWEASNPVERNKTPKRALIVAPTHLKFVQRSAEKSDDDVGYLSPNITRVWELMEREVRQAKALVFIGYSFPDADLYFSSILRSVLAVRDGAPAVAVVNPDAVAIGERLRQRFALDLTRFDRHFDLRNFVQGSRRNLLKSVGH